MEIDSINTFIQALKRGHIGTEGITPKLFQLVEHFNWFSNRLGEDKVWIEIYGEIAAILETIKEKGCNISVELPKNSPFDVIGKMNDDGSYNPVYKLKKGSLKAYKNARYKEQRLLIECWQRLAIPKVKDGQLISLTHDYSNELEALEAFLRKKKLIDKNGLPKPTKDQKLMPAIPPENYKGSLADWETYLCEMGKLRPGQWYGDVDITEEEWWELLRKCEEE